MPLGVCRAPYFLTNHVQSPSRPKVAPHPRQLIRHYRVHTDLQKAPHNLEIYNRSDPVIRTKIEAYKVQLRVPGTEVLGHVVSSVEYCVNAAKATAIANFDG